MTTPKCPPELWPAVRRLFDAALALPADARATWLQGSGEPPEVVAEVLSLLTHSLDGTRADSGFLATPAAATGHPGLRLGPWRLTEPLGSGGMGEVWLALRDDGAYEGEAAIKLLKRGMDSAAVLQRFAQERQALARLDHPCIARLMDAGLSPQGLPYFVMERVLGRPLDAACAGLPLETRLQLFLQLTDAVAHAHRHLLVHRDLKPGNVLVTADRQVKLLDFGIAKALDPTDGEAGAEHTLARPFTPSHASPEQVRGEPVSTATDVYSLGVLLYQLLTGQRPYGRDARTPQALAQAVLNEAPTRPSSLGEPREPPADWWRTRLRLKGDLDNILLKTLEKDPARRYASVDALAADLRAHLDGRPVSARAPTPGYLAARFVGRHRLAVGLAGVAALALVAGLAGTLWQMREARAAQSRAEARFTQVRELARQLVFRYHDQIAQLPGSLATREALLQDALRYLDGLATELGPELARQPALARELAESYSRIAELQGDGFSPSQERLDAARRDIDKAIALQPLYLPAVARDATALREAADMHQGRALLASRAGRLGDSVAALQRARALNQQVLELDPQDPQNLAQLATVTGRMGLIQGGSPVQAQLGDVAGAGRTLAEAVELFGRLRALQPESAEWAHQAAWGHQLRANWALLSGNLTLAQRDTAAMLELRDIATRGNPQNSNYRYQQALARISAARIASATGEHDEAQRLLDDGGATLRQELARDPRNQAARRDLALLGLAQARARWQARPGPDAARELRNALAAFPPPDALTGDFYLSRWRAEAAWWAGRSSARPADKLRLAREAGALMQVGSGPDDNASRRWMLALALGLQAQAEQEAGDSALAASSAARALALWGDTVPALYRDEAELARRIAAR
ncbi:protein kinase domain-containing protein [Roseateles sp.]|uniref:serine/threonine-protein kinase n=1 Tax=Roseateles sp. TaxID=1971397 RepID=UPI0039EB1F88